MFALHDVEVRRGMTTVMSGCTLSIQGGQTVVLSGNNGAGKSTLLETIAGLLPLEHGRVQHQSTVIRDAEGRARTSPLNIGMVLQKNGMLGSEVVVEHLHCAMARSGRTVDVAPFLRAFGLTHRTNDLVAHLSQGQARKVAVLAALLPAFASATPALVLLDEPDAGLDDASINTLRSWLDELRLSGHALLIATHDERIRQQATHLLDMDFEFTEVAAALEEPSPEPREASASKPVSPAKFGLGMHLRTMMWLNTNAMAGLLTLGILLSLGDFHASLSEAQRWGFVLAPCLAVGLCGEPLVAALREERSADWWRAVGGGEPHASWLPLALGFAFSLMTALALNAPVDERTLFVGSLLCFMVWHGVGWLQRSTQRLARPQAVFVGLLTPVLILPYALLIDLLA